MAKAPAIGIDLGTTNACVAVFQNGKVEIIANDQGNRTTPNYVAFTDTGRLIGDAAKNQLALSPCNTIFDAKRLIGRNFEDPSVQSDMEHWPFEVVSDVGGKPKLVAEYTGEKKTFYPEEISSMVLTKIKETAEAYIGKKVTDAVIAVPAYFNESQRQATRDAATIAGLNVNKLISEPTAAAIAYGLDKNVKGAQLQNILIFDLGGSSSNVSILRMKDGVFEVVSTAGDTYLGGEDFDNRIVDHFLQEFEWKFKKDLTTSKRALHRLRTACEQAKRTLSSSTQASIEIVSLFDGIDFNTSITRARFECMNADLFRRTLEPVESSLLDAKMNNVQIHDVVLVGGSSRIPKIQKLLRDFVNGKELNTSMNPDEAVAYGAAIQAAIIHGDKSKEVKDLLLHDVIPFSLGLKTDGGFMRVLVKKNTSIPTKQTRSFLSHDELIEVYEGERVMTENNNLLGKIDITSTPRSLAGGRVVDISFDIDAYGVLNMTAVGKTMPPGIEKKMMINPKGRLSRNEIQRMVNEAEKHRADKEKQKDRDSAKNSLESYCFNLKSTVEDVLDKCRGIIRWLDANPVAEKEEFENKQKYLKEVCHPIITEMYNAGAPPPAAAGFSGARPKRSRLSQN